jgi:hypothetical protein
VIAKAAQGSLVRRSAEMAQIAAQLAAPDLVTERKRPAGYLFVLM